MQLIIFREPDALRHRPDLCPPPVDNSSVRFLMHSIRNGMGLIPILLGILNNRTTSSQGEPSTQSLLCDDLT